MKRTPLLSTVVLAGAGLLAVGCASTTTGSATSAAAPSAASSSAPTSTEASTGDSASASESAAADGGIKTVSVARDVSPADWCGDKPLKVGVSDGYGGNAWRQISLETIRQEALKCPAVDPKILYTNANGDPAKASSDINSLVAQGVNVLIVYPDFGEAQLPALRAAKEAGVTVIPYDGDPGGTPGQDYTAKIVMDAESGGKDLGEWMGKTLGSGNIVFLGGIPAAPTSATLMKGIQEALTTHPDVKLLVDQPVTTNWNKVDAQKAVAGLLAKYPKIDGVITDYGVTAVAAINAFQAAGKPVPAIASLATSNELGCVWKDAGKKGAEFPIFSVDSTNDMAQWALRMGVAAANDKPVDPVQKFRMPPFMDSKGGNPPQCITTLPPDADLSSPLSQDQLAKLFA